MNNIEILEEFIKYFEAEATQRKYRRNISITVGEDDIEAIENLIKENKELEKENFNLKEKQIIDKCEVPTQDNFYDYYAQNYLQIPVSFLTKENLDWLEQHCEKTIRYATRNELKEHQITLELIVKYKEMNKEIRDLKENKAHQGLLDLYNKEKEKNKELEEYANWHIEHLTEDIADYIDDDKKGNASIIGEFKEEREHWKDIIRIMNNEKTYIDYKNY